jgi:hypothetical protein
MMPALLMLVSASAVADECDARAEQIAPEVGATVRTRIGPAIKMQHPEAENLSVNCRDSILSRVSGSRDAPGSIAGFGLLMSRASSLALGDTEQGAMDTLLKCTKAAADRAGTIVETVGPRLKVQCYVLRNYVTFDVTRR